MNIIRRFRVWLADVLYDASDWLDPIENDPEPELKPAPVLYDVALAMLDDDGKPAPSIAIVMEHKTLRDLAGQWSVTRDRDSAGATTFPIMRNGQAAYMGILLSNVRALTAMPVQPNTKGEA